MVLAFDLVFAQRIVRLRKICHEDTKAQRSTKNYKRVAVVFVLLCAFVSSWQVFPHC